MWLPLTVSALVVAGVAALLSPVRLRLDLSRGYGRDGVEAGADLFWGALGIKLAVRAGRTSIRLNVGPRSLRPPRKRAGGKPPEAKRITKPESAGGQEAGRWAFHWWRIIRSHLRPVAGALYAFYRRFRPSLLKLDTRIGLSDPAGTGYLCALRAALTGLGLPPDTWRLTPDFLAPAARTEVALRLHFLLARIVYAGMLLFLWAAGRAFVFLVTGPKQGYFSRRRTAKQFALKGREG